MRTLKILVALFLGLHSISESDSAFTSIINNEPKSALSQFLSDILLEISSCFPLVIYKEDAFSVAEVSDLKGPRAVFSAEPAVNTSLTPFVSSLGQLPTCLITINLGKRNVNQFFQRNSAADYKSILVIENHFESFINDYPEQENFGNVFFIQFNSGSPSVAVKRLGFVVSNKDNPESATWEGHITKQMKNLLSDDIAKHTLIVCVTAIENEGIFQKVIVDGKETYEGYAARALEEISKRMKFKYKVIVAKHRRYGVNKNGSWTGIIGEVLAGKVDIAVNEFTMLYDRSKAVDFVFGNIFNGLGFMTKAPKLKSKWKIIFSIFSPTLWACVFGSITLCAVMIVALYKLSSKLQEKGSVDASLTWVQRFQSAFFYCFSLLTLHVPFDPPRVLSIRAFLGCILLFFLILSVSYTSNLTSSFSSPIYETVPDAYEGLVEEDYTFLRYNFHSSWDAAIASNATPLLTEIFKRLAYIQKKIEDPESDLSLRTYPWAYLGRLKAIKSKIQIYDFVDYAVGKEQMLVSPHGWVLRKKSPLREPLTKALLRLVEAGLLDHWFAKDYGRAAKRMGGKTRADLHKKKEKEEVKILGMQDLISPFILLLVGLSLSIVCFILELLVHKVMAQ